MIYLKDFLKKHFFSITVSIGWIITVYLLYIIKYKMFGGAIEVLLLYIIVFPPVIAVTNFLSEPKESKKKAKKKINYVLDVIMIIAIICFLIWSLFTSPYNIQIYDFFIILILLAILSVFTKLQEKLKNKANQRERSIFVLSVFAILIIIPMVFIPVANIKTIRQAEDLLEDIGFSNVTYLDIINNEKALNIVFDGKTTVTENTPDDLGFYLFKISKENKDYCVAVNIIGGELVGESLVEDNPYVYYYIK